MSFRTDVPVPLPIPFGKIVDGITPHFFQDQYVEPPL